ncbi:hypothetical protein JCGZ_08898 [Jatropha curcas]|uniref:Uncharacterized protein n=1 Tax=Jatropha curcas TaxID=180498 RepID=A0A067KW66_JATCU|nr:hypothetical protein JCGZ_08898 [Jatropha curcas]
MGLVFERPNIRLTKGLRGFKLIWALVPVRPTICVMTKLLSKHKIIVVDNFSMMNTRRRASDNMEQDAPDEVSSRHPAPVRCCRGRPVRNAVDQEDRMQENHNDDDVNVNTLKAHVPQARHGHRFGSNQNQRFKILNRNQNWRFKCRLRSM